ncbi:MAG: peptidoglycan DD-metalloendopeptidase family protein [bacterium]|nr:peptidoglycan DD-metalloendopeptidase family protein [bacterium]
MSKKAVYFFVVFFFLVFVVSANADTILDLESKISERNKEIQNLEKEIKEIENQIESIGNETKTLEDVLKQLNLTDKKLTADIRLTVERIKKAAATIEELTLLIVDKEKRIKDGDGALSHSIRKTRELDSRSFIEIIFGEFGFAGFWNNVQSLGQFQNEVNKRIQELQELKIDHERAKESSEQEKRNFVALNARLADQKEIVRQNKVAKNALLSETKNKESNYKQILTEREKKRESLELELQDYESRLRVEIDPASLPKPGQGVLRWPLNSVTVTQYFGNTPFASKNPQVYKNKGHNGIDLRAAVGTVVMSAANGTVLDVGDTDTVRSCYSYGKWVLIKHYNGLATLYAHLSLIRATPGQEISVGEIVGYSGRTGYATGPHLHFTVYAAQGVRVERFANSINCKNADIPIAPTEGYLNPLSYL